MEKSEKRGELSNVTPASKFTNKGWTASLVRCAGVSHQAVHVTAGSSLPAPARALQREQQNVLYRLGTVGLSADHVARQPQSTQ